MGFESKQKAVDAEDRLKTSSKFDFEEYSNEDFDRIERKLGAIVKVISGISLIQRI
jgi:hypothetical protein